MKKIVYCIPGLYNSGGMERVLIEKVNYLISHLDCEITIITTDQGNNPIYFNLNPKVNVIDFQLNFLSHYQERFLKKTILHLKKLSLYKKKLDSYLIDNKIDICISLGGKEVDFLYSLKASCKKIVELHFSMNSRTQFLLSRKKNIFWKWLGMFRTHQLKNATKKIDRLVVLTKQDYSQWSLSHKNVELIPNPSPIIVDYLSPLINKKVLSIGRLDPQKGYDMLIDAWEKVRAEITDWTLEIYGEGELKDVLEKKIQIKNLLDSVYLKGTTKNVVEQYMDSSIFVMSSRYEGLPMVLIEAMTCGLPIVSFDCECGPREVIEDGKSGFLVSPENITQLADKLILLIKDHDLRQKMSYEAAEKAKQYSIEKIMEKWVLLFNN